MSDVERTLPASPRRRAWAREQGYSPRSAVMTGTLVLMVAAALAATQGLRLLEGIGNHLRTEFTSRPALALDTAQAVDQLREHTLSIALLAGWWLAAVWGASLAFNLLQTGFQWSPAAFSPDISRIDPSIGFWRMFSVENVAAAMWSLLVVTALVAGAGYLLCDRLNAMNPATSLSTGAMAASAIESTTGVILQLSGMLVLLATIDVVWRRWRFEASLRMSPDELRDETDRRKRPRAAANS